ncbi:Alpha/beta hydrolase family protein [Botrimarina colliarenosi]|uniref:Alpha/beta hydrolase family protein n=1 Tax=Botrimarina colliarenosi TaxID=2528001 RepID=A0A5C6A199_9BACT|nr:alpha/beta fold hydrolase [Botrimarina colliarenosi]TWT92323.1 Alpha/beta hydrolase family protein [Botrimarina colliarenosi]
MTRISPFCCLALLTAAIATSCHAARVLQLQEVFAAEKPAPDGNAPGSGFLLHFELTVRFDDPIEHAIAEAEILVWRVPDEGDTSIRVAARQQATAEASGLYRLDHNTAKNRSTFSVNLDDLALQPGGHRLLFEARMSDATGRVSSVVSDPVRVNVIEPSEVTGVRNEEQTETRNVPQILTKIVTVTLPDGTQRNEEREYYMMKRVSEVRTVTVSEIEPGSYSRKTTYSTVSAPPIDTTDPNIADELRRIRSLHGSERERLRTVYYATNRSVTNAASDNVERFGNTLSGEMHYGSAVVRIPPTHRYGDTTKAPYWTVFDNPEEHFRVQTVNELDQGDFYTVMRNRLGQTVSDESRTGNDVLLYVHGFNTTMKFALLRMAQISFDVGFAGTSCAFVWPSDGSKLGYSKDLADADASIDRLKELLVTLAQSSGEGRVHLIAHSMGNYIALQALQRAAAELPTSPEGRKPFGHVVLAAPDVWLNDFNQWAPATVRQAQSVTFYHCEDDWALKLSTGKHGVKARAGLSSVPLIGLDSVDCNEANTTFLGHSAYADASPLLFDIQMLLQKDALPDRRPLMKLSEFTPGYWFWRARADLAPVIAVLDAGSPLP